MLAQKQEVRSRNPNFDKINASAEAFFASKLRTQSMYHTHTCKKAFLNNEHKRPHKCNTGGWQHCQDYIGEIGETCSGRPVN